MNTRIINKIEFRLKAVFICFDYKLCVNYLLKSGKDLLLDPNVCRTGQTVSL